MIRHDMIAHQPNTEVLPAPPQDRQIHHGQLCPHFSGQSSSLVPIVESCFFCQYGDFHKNKPKVLEIGCCRYPNVQIR